MLYVFLVSRARAIQSTTFDSPVSVLVTRHMHNEPAQTKADYRMKALSRAVTQLHSQDRSVSAFGYQSVSRTSVMYSTWIISELDNYRHIKMLSEASNSKLTQLDMFCLILVCNHFMVEPK
jgi:hypothetical protein